MELQKLLSSDRARKLRKLEGASLLDLPLDDAFLLDAATRSDGGRKTSWLENSWRGHQAAAHLFMIFVEQDLGQQPRVKDVTRYHCEIFPELIEQLPAHWNKGDAMRGGFTIELRL